MGVNIAHLLLSIPSLQDQGPFPRDGDTWPFHVFLAVIADNVQINTQICTRICRSATRILAHYRSPHVQWPTKCVMMGPGVGVIKRVAFSTNSYITLRNSCTCLERSTKRGCTDVYENQWYRIIAPAFRWSAVGTGESWAIIALCHDQVSASSGYCQSVRGWSDGCQYSLM